MNELELLKLKSNAESAVVLLKTMAHRDRLLILCHLSEGEISAGDLARKSLLSQSAFSQHLAILRNEELVTTRRSSQMIYYSLANSDVLNVLMTLKQIFCNEND